MRKGNDEQELKVPLPSEIMRQLEKIAREQFYTDIATLARFWIIERLQQLGVSNKSYPINTTIPGHFDTGSQEFKNLVLQYAGTMIQSEAMRKAAEKLGVDLPDSYLKYPGSHIYRWHRQGYPK